MAQPVFNLIQYVGGAHIEADTSIKTSDAPVGTNVIVFKTETSKVFIDGTDAFTVKYGEMTFFDQAASPAVSYKFTTAVDIAFGTVTEVT